MLYWLQINASQSGFWIFMGFVSVLVTSAGYIFRLPLEGDTSSHLERLRETVAFWVCVAIAGAVLWLLAPMVGR